MRWTGNGLADGTTLTSGNINAEGNGDPLGPPNGTLVTAGNGFTFGSATVSQINRQNATFTASKGGVFQGYYTPEGSPTTASERIGNFRSASANATGFSHLTTGEVVFEFGTAPVVASRTPALIAGHLYQIDWVTALSASPTTSNGRQFWRIKDLTDPTWNTTGDFFYDTGYVGNAGTADLSIFRVGKLAGTGAVPVNSKIEWMGWDAVTVAPSDTSRAQAEAYFLAPAVVAVTATGGMTLGGSSVAGSPGGGGNTVTATGVMTLAGTEAHRTVTGMVGLIGDSTLWQDGKGESRIKAKLLPKGYANAQVGYYANIGKAWFLADSNGKTVPQNISDIRAALGGDPDVWLFNLGSNGSGRTEDQVRSDIDIAFDNVPPGTHRILFVGLSQADGASNAATRQRWNSYAKPRVEERGGEWLDWYTYQKSIGDAGVWQADNVHMTDYGYEVKNTFTSNAIGSSELNNYREATAGLILSGTATAFARVSVPATGVVGLSGTATAVGFETRTANGTLTLTITGTAASVARELRSAPGGLTLTGTAGSTQNTSITVEAFTYLEVNGLGTAYARLTSTATGTLVASGTATPSQRVTSTAEGTLYLTGSATYRPNSTGSVTYMGDVPVQIRMGDYPALLNW